MSEYGTSGHIGAFYFGDDYDNATPYTSAALNISPAGVSATVDTSISEDASITIYTSNAYGLGEESFKSGFVAKKVTDTDYPECYIVDHEQIAGGNPVAVDFSACVNISEEYVLAGYQPVSYTWWFDYENYSSPELGEVTTEPYTQHTYCGGYLTDYDVRMCTLFSSRTSGSDITVCSERDSLVKTYGVDELKFGQDRHINLTNYLPEYVRNSETEDILQVFEDYLNEMYNGQKNYTWDEEALEVTVCDTSACKQWTSCNDIEMCSGACSADGTCGNLASSAVTNTYNFEGVDTSGVPLSIFPVTPAESAGEVFINDVCVVKDDKISILDKIFRLTDLFDPDLMPDELIQFYAENLGYQAGINRDAIGISRDDEEAIAIEQKRYLRFMIRNLPNWYQIKSNRASIRIMMYSFGLVGDFVYYYTKCYTDMYDRNSQGLCLVDNDLDGDGIPDGIANTECNMNNVSVCDSLLSDIPEITTVEELAKYRSCLSKYRYNVEAWTAKTKALTGTTDDWLLTDVNLGSLEENLDPIPENQGYFSSPHFKLWINLDGSTGNYSTDEERQRMIKIAVNAIKPINTVFDGVAVYWETLVMRYSTPYQRIRKHMRIISDGTYTSATPLP